MLSSFSYVLLVLFLLHGAFATTNPDEATTLKNLYYSLQKPSALSSWTNVDNNPDPCGQSWQGIKCSGSKVTEIRLSGLGLSGSLTYDLDKLTSLSVMDFSNNQITGNIPYGLPPNVQTINLANNKLSGSLPYSIGQLTQLTNLYVQQNGVSGSLQDMFSNLGSLKIMDLSSNSLSGQLPESFSSLTSLASLYLQNNQFTGSVNVLANLPLENLNIQNNKFTGWVPSTFSSIPNAQYGGNSFSTSPAPPPPPYTPPPPGKSSKKKSSSGGSSGSGSGASGGTIAGIVIAVILSVIVIGLIVAYFLWKPKKKYAHDDEKFQSTTPVLSMPAQEFDTQEIKEKHEAKASLLPIETVLKPPPSEGPKESIIEKIATKKLPFRRGKNQISATAYSVSDLQVATDSFSEDHIIGEGALGPVYKAEMPKGKVLAVKKIETSSATENEEDFMDIVSTVSRVRHSNIAELVGYCVEHGQRLLVYDYFSRGSLADTLHLGDEATKRELTWNIRVKIALGAARALEYLHEVSQPAIIHKNFKSANILLDEEFNPHVSDCGTADLASDLESQAAAVVDSAAYRAPEYTMSGVYTWQSDVYSFGVVMLELLTGRKPMDNTRPRSEQSLVRWATPQLHDIDALANMVDPTLDGHYPVKSLSRFADIIALCVQPEMEFRPSMSEVVQSLVRLMQRATNKRRSGDDQRGQDSSDV